jgi:GH24 family phage-related lysozyme (muramidase)
MKEFNDQVSMTAYLEGFREQAYWDEIGKVWTIGYGTTRIDNQMVKQNMICTQAQALVWLSFDLKNLKNRCFYRLFPQTYDSGVSDAISDYAYNIGFNGFPKLYNYLKRRDINKASLEFLNGFYANGQPVLGLLLRRISEYNTFLTGKYTVWEISDSIDQDMFNNLINMNNENSEALKMIRARPLKDA